MSLLIGRSWSWIGSCGGGGQAIETSFVQGTCVLGIDLYWFPIDLGPAGCAQGRVTIHQIPGG